MHVCTSPDYIFSSEGNDCSVSQDIPVRLMDTIGPLLNINPALVKSMALYKVFLHRNLLYWERLLAPYYETSEIEDHPLQAVCDCLFNMGLFTFISADSPHALPEFALCGDDTDALIMSTKTVVHQVQIIVR